MTETSNPFKSRLFSLVGVYLVLLCMDVYRVIDQKHIHLIVVYKGLETVYFTILIILLFSGVAFADWVLRNDNPRNLENLLDRWLRHPLRVTVVTLAMFSISTGINLEY